MTKTILIAYATATGTTATIADLIRETLHNEHSDDRNIVCQPIKHISSVIDYDAVIIGSAINYGRWLPPAIAFIDRHHHDLRRLPVAIFSVHIQNLGDDAKSTRNRAAYTDDVYAHITPRAEAFFAGRFNRQGAHRLMPSLLARLMPNVDLIDTDTVRDWTINLIPQMQLV